MARGAFVRHPRRRRAVRLPDRVRKVRPARKREAPAGLDEIGREFHAKQPLDAILVTGGMTDARRSAEWAEFFEAFAPYPRFTGFLIGLPGNHSVNVVDRANPARPASNAGIFFIS